jgi:hypothetical protein
MKDKFKERLLLGVYKHLSSKDFTNFNAKIEKFTPPKKIVEEQSNEAYIPDLTATHSGTSCLFDLVLDKFTEENEGDIVKRWSTIYKHAQSIDGKYYLVINVDQFDDLMVMINKYNLENIGILQFESN